MRLATHQFIHRIIHEIGISRISSEFLALLLCAVVCFLLHHDTNDYSVVSASYGRTQDIPYASQASQSPKLELSYGNLSHPLRQILR